MKVKEIKQRINSNALNTGRAIAYIKDALEEINVISETNIRTERIDLTKNQRFYDFPNEMVKVLEVRAKNHLNSKDEYRKIPRLIHEPKIKDADGS